MNTQDIVNVLVGLPESMNVGDLAYWKNKTPSYLRLVLNQVVDAYDWTFSTKSYETQTVTAGRNRYEITGKKNDLRDIINIKYGSNKIVLSKLRPLDADGMLQNNPSISGVNSWYIDSQSSKGFPEIILIGTPIVTGDILYIRYRVKNIPLTQFPSEFNHVIAYGILSWVNPAYLPVFETQIRKMVKRHSIGGKDYNPAPGDPHIAMTNRRNAVLSSGGRTNRRDS